MFYKKKHFIIFQFIVYLSQTKHKFYLFSKKMVLSLDIDKNILHLFFKKSIYTPENQ